jgi:ankyrin repeat protein
MKYIVSTLSILFLLVFSSCVDNESKERKPTRSQRENDFIEILTYHQAIEARIDEFVADNQLEKKILTERVSEVEYNYWTLLSFASFIGDRNAVEYIVSKGANVNFKDGNGETPLMLAATAGNIENIEVLLKHGADINAKDINDFTAVILAAEQGNIKTVEYLVGKGCDLGQTKADMNALDFAIFYKQKEVIDFLKKKGMRPTDTLGKVLNHEI